jgi:hypothetical protein
VSCELTIDQPQIAAVGDGATLPPFNITDLATLTVKVFYDDGSSKDFTYDDRAVLTVTRGSDLVEIVNRNQVRVLSSAIIEPDLSWDVTVEVTFPGLYNCSDSVDTTVVEFEYLTLSAYHSPSDVSLIPISELKSIHCSGLYQRAELRATGYLTDGTWKGGVSFSRWVNFTSSDVSLGQFTAQPCFHGLCRGLATTSSGSLTVKGTFGGKAAYLPVVISGDSVTITSVEILDTIGEFETLHGVVGTTDNMEVLVTFSDGSSLVVSDFGTESSDWLKPSDLLTFASEVPDIISVDEEGIVTLHSNYFSTNELSVIEKCENKYTDSRKVYANLDPEMHDVDLGHLYGASLRQQNIGDYFNVDVRIQASETEALSAFQIKVTFNYEELQVDSDDLCGNLYGWGWSFECTSNDPENELLMVGTCGFANTDECGTFNNNLVGFITFKAKKSGFIHLQGHVIKNMGNETITTNTPLFAGDAYFWVVSGDDDDSFTEADMKAQANALMGLETRRRRLATDVKNATVVSKTRCDTMQGDTNGDCVCDVADVQIIQYYIGGQKDLSHLTSREVYSLDANLDGVVDSADVVFLLRIVAYKYRFLADYSTTPHPFTLEISMLTWQSLPSHQNQSDLWLELALDVNKDLNMTFDYGNVTSSPDGVFIVPKQLGIGKFGAGGMPRDNEFNVPLVVIVETYNVFGKSSKSRLCPFYCTRRIEACRNAFGDSADAFIPFKYPNLTIPAPTAGI